MITIAKKRKTAIYVAVFFYILLEAGAGGVGNFYRKAGDSMTNKQRKFCDEYLIACNATRAYKAAYPNIKSDEVARKAGSRLLTYVDIKEYIHEQLNKISSAKIADAKEVLEYLTAVLRGKSESEIVVVEGCGEGYSAAKKIKKFPDEKERTKAAELLCKYYGFDKINIEGIIPVVISGESELKD